MGHGARGLQRKRRCLELLHPRSSAVAGVPVGRGWNCRCVGRPADSVFFAGAVEWGGPNSEGASVRVDELRGQSWGRCEGVLLLHRFDAYSLIHEDAVQVSAERLSVRRPGCDECEEITLQGGV